MTRDLTPRQQGRARTSVGVDLGDINTRMQTNVDICDGDTGACSQTRQQTSIDVNPSSSGAHAQPHPRTSVDRGGIGTRTQASPQTSVTVDPGDAATRAPDRSRTSIGVDLGGTGTRVLALDADGTVLHQASFPTPRQAGPAALERLLAAIGAAAEAAGPVICGVGVGASGPVTADGIVDNPATLPAFTGLDLSAAVRDALGLSCLIENDAAAAAIGEHAHGAGCGSRASVTVTLGTGIGVAVIVDGRLVRAGDGTHPEGGHIAVPDAPTSCYCGLPKCWEQAASRTALEAMTGSDPAIVAEAARRGDIEAGRIFELYGRRVASGLASLLTLFRPDRVVLGGSGARYLDLYADALEVGLERNVPYRWMPPILPARLGDMAGAVGAAVLARTAGPGPQG